MHLEKPIKYVREKRIAFFIYVPDMKFSWINHQNINHNSIMRCIIALQEIYIMIKNIIFSYKNSHRNQSPETLLMHDVPSSLSLPQWEHFLPTQRSRCRCIQFDRSWRWTCSGGRRRGKDRRHRWGLSTLLGAACRTSLQSNGRRIALPPPAWASLLERTPERCYFCP